MLNIWIRPLLVLTEIAIMSGEGTLRVDQILVERAVLISITTRTLRVGSV